MAAPKDPIVVSEEAYAVQFFSRTGLDTEAVMAAVAGEAGGSTCAAADVGSSVGGYSCPGIVQSAMPSRRA